MQRFHLGLVFSLFTLVGCQVSDDSFSQTGDSTGNSNASDSEVETSTGDHSVSLYWSAPLERVNGETMANTEIAGYEIRYRKDGDTEYERIVLEDASATQYHIDNLSSVDYQFEVAAIDTFGLYSDFVKAEL